MSPANPVLPWDVLLLLIAPPVLAGVVVSLVGYRLDDIEPVVRRSVVQGAVAAAVGTAFVVVADTVGRATDVPVGAILAGGVVALLVLPLALALQRGVRRLVYGERDLPRTVVSELRRLDATSAPTEAVAETLELLARRLRLSYAAIDVPASDGAEPLLASVGRSVGKPVTVDLVAGGIRLGALHLEAGPDRDAFGRGDRLLLEDVGAQVGALVQAVLANRELMRSRHELVSAREEERRRLRRDLHDGLGPSLATLALRLETAEDLIATDPAQAAELVGGLADLARDEIAEVRRLVEGLRPPALDQLGLVSALRQRAAQHELAAGDGDVVWTVEADRDVEPLPAAVEVAAYRIVLEAVTNAVRHGGGRACTVTLRREDGHLRVRVQDDGQGLVVGSPGWCRPVLDEGAGPGARRYVHHQLHGERHPRRRRAPYRGGGPHMTDTMRVLVVDDHEEFRHSLEALLGAMENVEVVGRAGDGRRAVEMALDLQPDVVVMDLHMPQLNGVEATARIVQSSPHISVLVLTMMEDDDSVFAAVRAGARGYLLKGARRQEIRRAIEAVGAGEVIFGPGIAERVMTYFRHVRSRPSAQAFPDLTDRERQILGKIAEGLDNAEIARDLTLSVKTVRNHASNIFAKLHVAHRAQAIVLAREAGIENPGPPEP